MISFYKCNILHKKVPMITIIIPTRNRLSYLEKFIKYASTQPFNYIIADNSTDFKTLPSEIVLSQNIKFYHFENSSFSEKVNYCLDLVKTKYVMMNADDDFFLKSAILECINFLETNNDYSTVHGNTLSFYVSKNKVGYQKMYPQEIGLKTIDDNYSERVQKIFSPYLPLFYSINRTENFKLIFSNEFKNSNLSFIEFQIAFISALMGKFKVLPILYHIREQGFFSAGFVSKSIFEMSQDGDEKKILDSFTNHLALMVSKEKNISIDLAISISQNSLLSYINWVKSLPISNNKLSYAYFKKKYLKPYFPSLFSWLVKQKKAAEINHQQINHLNLSNYSNADILKEELVLIESVILNVS
jgi:glycosyltransferase domain-containing protein